MISVRNLRLQLSGNKWLAFLVILVVAGACSPKTSTVRKTPQKNQPKVPVKTPEEEKAQKEKEEKEKTAQKEKPKQVKKKSDRFSTVSLILPFGLDNLRPGAKYSPAQLKMASLALEYFRGFKLALDSLTEQGANYRLQLYDSKDDPAQSHSLAQNPVLNTSNLIVGPVFPEGIKAFTSTPDVAGKLILSPLSPAAPSTYNNPNLITVIPPLEYHAWRVAEYINDRAIAKKVYILTSGYTDEKPYINYFKEAIDSLSKKRIKVITLKVSGGNLKSIVPQMTKFDQNFVVIPSTRQEFLKITLYSLDTLSRQYPLTLFGHPNWDRLTFLKADQLQKLNAHITSGDRVDYKSAAVVTFIRNYRRAYHTEPGEYAIKGFDEGLFFGQILAEDPNKLTQMDRYDFTGLHNSFHFMKKPGQGWINTHVDLLKYANFELRQVQ